MDARRIVVLSLCALLLAGTTPAAVAQSGTPAAGSGDASCASVEPRDASFFEAVAATPAADADQGTPAQGTPTPFTMPAGEPADEETIAAVTVLYQQLVDCLNAGDYLRAYALYTDDYLLRNLTAEAIGQLEATPVPSEAAMQTSFGSVLDARLLPDGRVAALVTTSNPQSGDIVIFATLRRDGDRLLIDEEQVVEAAAATPVGAATPAA